MSVVDGATHSQKDGVTGSNKLLEGRSRGLYAVSAWRSAGSAVECLTVFDLDEVNVTLENAEIFGSVLSGEGGSVGGGWRCCRSALGLPQLPPATPRNPLPFIASLLLFRFRGDGRHPDGWR